MKKNYTKLGELAITPAPMATKIEYVFPTVILKGKFPKPKSLNQRLMDEIISFRTLDKMGKSWSKENYRHGYTSYGSLSDMHRRSPVFMELEERLAPSVEQFKKAQGWNARSTPLEMTACWMNVMGKNTYHTLHLHPHAVVSGVYYVDAPSDGVALKIEDPRMAHYMNAPPRQGSKNELYYKISPVPGTFVLFESWLRHEVPPNVASADRVSISFNYSVTTE
jgi:uncharacterized protein (TIGR02466 family)